MLVIDFSRAVLYGMFHQEKPYRMDQERTLPVKNSFVQQFAQNINFKYVCFDRVTLRGYIRHMFFPAGVITFLKLMGFRKISNGVMRILTNQLNSHIHWWPPQTAGQTAPSKSSYRINTPGMIPKKATACIVS